MAGPQVLTISSHVAAGPVGNSAIVPALLALGVTPVAVPTVFLSNHPGHGQPEGLPVPAKRLSAILQRLASLGFLRDDAIILTGYFAGADQVEAVADFLHDRPRALYLCDPVLGDSDSGLYIDKEIALALRRRLLPLADAMVPNAFELGWLAGAEVTSLATARSAAQAYKDKSIVATSIPDGRDRLMTALIANGRAVSVTRPLRRDVPHGTGDLLSGLLAARIAKGHTLEASLGHAVAAAERVIAASAGTQLLDLANGLHGLDAIEPFGIAEHG